MRRGMPSSWFPALAGGLLIGLASAILLVAHGRIAGVSGVVTSLWSRATRDRAWRAAFVAGLLIAGVVAAQVAPASIGAPVRATPALVIAGLLVGYGTRLGSGCTSGHGVCGLARLSPRSIAAVATFLATGVLTATLAGGVA